MVETKMKYFAEKYSRLFCSQIVPKFMKNKTNYCEVAKNQNGFKTFLCFDSLKILITM